MADHSITAIDRTLLKAKGHVWHKSSMNKGIAPCRASIQMQDGRGIVIPKDGWIFGYKLHLTCTTAIEGIIVPLTVDVTTANMPDNKMYVP